MPNEEKNEKLLPEPLWTIQDVMIYLKCSRQTVMRAMDHHWIAKINVNPHAGRPTWRTTGESVRAWVERRGSRP